MTFCDLERVMQRTLIGFFTLLSSVLFLFLFMLVVAEIISNAKVFLIIVATVLAGIIALGICYSIGKLMCGCKNGR